MITQVHKKIAIVGNAGSGKTTLAFQLQEKLGLSLCHLDQYYWKSNWQRVGFEEFNEIHDELCEKDEWIMEGSYISVLQRRVLRADVVIFLDMPRYLCIWRVLKRAVFNFSKVIPGNPENCKQQLFSFKFLEFLKWVWAFNNRNRQMILNIFDDDEFTDKKQIFVLKSPKKVAAFVQQLEKIKKL